MVKSHENGTCIKYLWWFSMFLLYLQKKLNMILTGKNRTHNKCRCCGEIKIITNFCKDNRNACGHSTLCKDCKKQQDKDYYNKIMSDPTRRLEENKKRAEWKKNNPDKVKKQCLEYNNRPEIKERKKQWSMKHNCKSNLSYDSYIRKMLKQAKNRALLKGLPFNIDKSDITIPEYCPILGTKLNWQSVRTTPPEFVPSIDKIIPGKGYVKGNVQIISFRANFMKSDSSIEHLLQFAKNIENYLNLYNEDIVRPVENKESTEL